MKSVDFMQAELDNRWSDKKYNNIGLAIRYKRLGISNPDRVSSCGNFVEFALECDRLGIPLDSSKTHLINANFCKDRLCPLCSWRRSLKNFESLSKIVSIAKKDYKFKLLTLTIKNCDFGGLSAAFDQLLKGWYTLSKSHYFKKHINGYFRSLEVTVGRDGKSWHPHLHVLCAIQRGCDDFWDNREIRDLWADALGIDDSEYRRSLQVKYELPRYRQRIDSGCSTPLVHSILEVSKYVVKSKDVGCISDKELRELFFALKSRRLFSFGGCLKDIAASLDLEDFEDPDLFFHSESLDPSLPWLISRFFYDRTFKGYVLQDVKISFPEDRKAPPNRSA